MKIRVAKAQWLTDDIISVWLKAPGLTRKTRPGQFFGVKVKGREDLLLRRPISVADVAGVLLRLVFRVVGKGTLALSRSRCGDEWDVLGPLGKPAPMVKGKDVIVCGGGVGAAPLHFLTRELRKSNRVIVLLGAERKAELILVNDFRRLGVKVLLATEDGSAGERGVVTELMGTVIEGLTKPVIYACGPRPMLKSVIESAGGARVLGFVEERMGCGVGICFCCAIEKKEGGYLRLCKDGPVVELNKVIL
ncbi:MAG: dihydroorotate dehydrogenase electron transfer subunit [bacterium]